jgi:hypothetical protein
MDKPQDAPGADEQWTCGKGLAEHAKIPTKMADFLKSLAANLREHVPTIDTSDAPGQAERDAYVHLSTEFEAVSEHLARTAKRMRACRDLPAAQHHDEALADARLLQVFERFVALEKELADLLATAVEEDGQLLQQFQTAHELE